MNLISKSTGLYLRKISKEGEQTFYTQFYELQVLL